MLHTVYARETGKKNVSKKTNEGSEINGVQTSTQLIVAGLVKTNDNGTTGIKEGRSKTTGKLYVTVNMEDIVTEDPNFGSVIEETSIVFIDKTGGKFGDQLDATKAQKTLSWVKDGKRTYVSGGTPLIIKCTKNTTEWEDGTTDVSYFGTTVVRVGKRTLSFKTNDNGVGCTTILSRIVVKDGVVYAPLDNWDKDLFEKLKNEGVEDASAQAQYTTWVTIAGADPTDERFAKAIGDDNQEHAAVCALVCAPKAYNEVIDESTNRVTSAEMQVEKIYRVN